MTAERVSTSAEQREELLKERKKIDEALKILELMGAQKDWTPQKKYEPGTEAPPFPPNKGKRLWIEPDDGGPLADLKGGEMQIEDIIKDHEESVRKQHLKNAGIAEQRVNEMRAKIDPASNRPITPVEPIVHSAKPASEEVNTTTSDFETTTHVKGTGLNSAEPTQVEPVVHPMREGTTFVADVTEFPDATKMLMDTAKIMSERQAYYGSPKKNHERIARYWTNWLRDRGMLSEVFVITSADVAIMQDLVKTARLAESIDHLDSIQDKAGYAGVLVECVKN
jgi:hypothetical protein